MRFPAKVEYAILAVFHLALRPDTPPLQARAIAKSQRIPHRFLEQVMNALRKAGIVESLRGAQGGYRLARNPSEIRLNDVVEAIEGRIAPGACVSGDEGGACSHEIETGYCVLKPVWEEVRSTITGVLDSLTVQDLVERKREREQQKTLMYHI